MSPLGSTFFIRQFHSDCDCSFRLHFSLTSFYHFCCIDFFNACQIGDTFCPKTIHSHTHQCGQKRNGIKYNSITFNIRKKISRRNVTCHRESFFFSSQNIQFLLFRTIKATQKRSSIFKPIHSYVWWSVSEILCIAKRKINTLYSL